MHISNAFFHLQMNPLEHELTFINSFSLAFVMARCTYKNGIFAFYYKHLALQNFIL